MSRFTSLLVAALVFVNFSLARGQSYTAGNQLAISSGKLTISENLAVPDASAENPNGVISNQEILIGSFVITAGSGEGSTLTVITLRDTLGTAAEVFQNLRLHSGGPTDANGNYSFGTKIGITVGSLTQGATSYDFRLNPAITLDANRQVIVNIYADCKSSALAEQVARVNNSGVGVFTVREVQGVGRQTSSSTSNSMTPGFDTLQRVYIALRGVFRTGLDSMKIESNVFPDSSYTGMGLYFSAAVEDMAFCQPIFIVYAQDALGNYINPLDVIGDVVFYTKHPDSEIREPLLFYLSGEIDDRPHGFMVGQGQDRLWRLVERGQTVFGGLEYKVKPTAKAGTKFWFVYYSEDVYKFDQEILTRPNIVVRGQSSSSAISPEQVPFRELIGPVITVVDSTAISPPPDSTGPPIFNFDGVIGPGELFRKAFELGPESPAHGFEFTFYCPGADSLSWQESAEFITQTRVEGDTLRVVGVSAQGGSKLGELVVKYNAPGTYEIPWSIELYLAGGARAGHNGTLGIKVLAEPAVSISPPVISVADSALVKLSPALGVLFGFGTDGIGGELRNGWFVPSLESVSLYDWQGKTEARTTLRFATDSGVFTAELTLKALLGDVSIDNSVNVIDVVMMLRNILGEVTFVSYQKVTADFDQSGGFDLWDVIALVRSILGLPQETHDTLPPVLTKAVAADLAGLISQLEAVPGMDQRAVAELKRLLGLETGEADVSVPTEFSLEQNFPNPFNPATTIKFALPKPGHVVLKIYNVLGQEVAELINAALPAGFHEVVWNAAGVSSGTYIYRLSAQGGGTETRKMALLK